MGTDSRFKQFSSLLARMTLAAGILALVGAPAAAASDPVLVTPPTISGVAQVGRALTATDARWGQDGFILTPNTYTWDRCTSLSPSDCVAIDTGSHFDRTYAVTSADLGSRIRVYESAGGTAKAQSEPTEVVTAAAPTCPAGQTGTPPNCRLPGPTPLARVGKLSVSPHAFRAAGGTNVTYTLDMVASVRFTVRQSLPGRKVKHGKKTTCDRPTRKNATRRKCTRIVTLKGSFTRTGIVGANKFHFTGRLGGKGLAPGTYTLVATPTAGGKTGQGASTGFKIVR